MLLDSVIVNSDKKYYPQIFLKKCKYATKNKRIINTISEDLELGKSDDDDC